MFRSIPALWQAPSMPPIPIATVLAGGGGSLTLLSASANQRIRLFGLHCHQDGLGSTTIELQDSTNAVLDTWDPNLAEAWIMNYYGAPLALGVGLKLVNTGPAAMTLRGGLTASQG
jgi:hypothetical protein